MLPKYVIFDFRKFQNLEVLFMDSTCRTRTVSSIAKDIKNEKISFKHKLQRPEGQWDRKRKSDLIDSLLRKYPVNPSYACKDNGILGVIDGVQRLSTLRDFLSDKFALIDDYDPVEINEEEKQLSGLKFSKFDDDTKDELLKAEIQIYELTNYTEKDIREIFRRQNAGKPLNNKQLRIVFEDPSFSDTVCKLQNHPFMEKLTTKAQRKNGTDRDLIVQTFMLMATNQENDFTSFRSKEMNDFVKSEYAIQILDRAPILEEAMDKFNETLESIKLPSTSIPQVLYSGYRTVKDKKSFSKLVDTVIDFVNNYDNNAEYKQYVQSGTSGSENVRARFDYWRNILRNMQ